jgi:hypothetical protein
MRWKWRILRGLLIAVAVAAGPVLAQQQEQQKEEQKKYGKTPEELRPFARFKQTPYKQFFVEPLEFLGPGRDKPEPDVDTVKIGIIAPLEITHEAYIGRRSLR